MSRRKSRRRRVPAEDVLRELFPPLPVRETPRPRDPGSKPLVSEYLSASASWFTALEIRVVPMPNGAHRQLVACPKCGRWSTRLYLPPGWPQMENDRAWRCRVCWGLHYDSEYAGRRPAASYDRLVALVEGVRRARKPETKQKRMERLIRAYSLMQKKEAAWLHRYLQRTQHEWELMEAEARNISGNIPH